VASNSPVEAPEGTAARPWAPERSWTSTSTVGLPRESRICRACTVSIWLIGRAGYLPGAQPSLRVELELLVRRELLPRRAGGLRQLLGALDAPAEALGGGAQRELRVDLELAGHVDGREQHVADLVELLLAALRLLELLQLAADGVVGHVLEV